MWQQDDNECVTAGGISERSARRFLRGAGKCDGKTKAGRTRKRKARGVFPDHAVLLFRCLYKKPPAADFFACPQEVIFVQVLFWGIPFIRGICPGFLTMRIGLYQLE